MSTTIPDAPTNVSVSQSSSSITVTWSAPAFDGNSPITGYTATLLPGGTVISTNSSTFTATFNGLAVGGSYVVGVAAVNAEGSSARTYYTSSMNDLIGKTMVVAFSFPTKVAWGRVFEFSLNSSTRTAIHLDGSADKFMVVQYFNSSNGYVTSFSAQAGQTYIVTYYLTSTGFSVKFYSFTSGVVTELSMGTNIVNPISTNGVNLTQLNKLWFGRDGNSTNVYYPLILNKVALYNGDFSAAASPTTLLQNLMNSSLPNTYDSTTYTFDTTARFLPVIMMRYGGTTASSSEIVLNGTNGYLEMYSYSNPNYSSALTVVAGVPSAPTDLAATAGDAQATVSWSAPASDGNSPILYYTVTSSPGSFTAQSSTLSATVTGLTNGTAYTFTVVATNALGNSPASSPSAPVTPVKPPAIDVRPFVESQAITYYWSFDTPSNYSSVTLTCSGPNGGTLSLPAAPPLYKFTGLTNGSNYAGSILAYLVGGYPSISSIYRTVQPGTPPSIPLNAVFTKVNNSVQVTWDPPATPGGNIQWYILRTPDYVYQFGIESYKSSFISTDISPGTYTWYLQAINDAGYSIEATSDPMTFP